MIERKHIEAIWGAVEDLWYDTTTKNYNACQKAITAARAALDESPCVWKLNELSGDYTPGCAPDTSTTAGGWRFVWSRGFRKSMAYCPHCSRKIADAPLPTAPEAEDVR